MTTFLKAITLAAFTATAAHAGGPVLVTEEPALPEMRPQGDGGNWIVPVILGALVLCAIACGGGDDAEPAAPPAPVPPGPVCNNEQGC